MITQGIFKEITQGILADLYQLGISSIKIYNCFSQ